MKTTFANNQASITVDVEEYFQVEAYAKLISPADWPNYESRVAFQMDLLLSLFDKTNLKATFFVLGIIAEKHPKLIAKIVENGHELASHGYHHQHITKISQNEFFRDIKSSKELLEDIANVEIKGYRAPCFSITPENNWAHNEIVNAGYKYSSSTYPIEHDFYGVPSAPRTPYYLNNGLLEIPVSTYKKGNKTKPAGGGGFFRLYPFFYFKRNLNKALKETQFINFYTHPWEYDPEQPKINGGLKSNFRHRVNQKGALNKLQRLCNSYQFDTLENIHLNKTYPTLGDWTAIAKGEF